MNDSRTIYEIKGYRDNGSIAYILFAANEEIAERIKKSCESDDAIVNKLHPKQCEQIPESWVIKE